MRDTRDGTISMKSENSIADGVTDEIEWSPSDDKYVEADTDPVAFSDVLYDAECTECGTRLTWTLVADPDSPVWEAECCDKYYSMYVETVSLTRSDATI